MISEKEAYNIVKEKNPEAEKIEIFSFNEEWWGAKAPMYVEAGEVKITAPGTGPIRVNKTTGEYKQLTIKDLLNGNLV